MIDTAQIISMIRSSKAEREKAIGVLYKDEKLRNGIKKIIGGSNNSNEKFSDIFNYTLVQFMKKVIENESFTINSSLHSYLFGIARNLWLMKLRSNNSKNTLPLEENYDVKTDEVSIDLQIINSERKELLEILMNKVGQICKELLMLWASGYKMKEISKITGIMSEGSVRKKKFDCMKKLNQQLALNPQLKENIKE